MKSSVKKLLILLLIAGLWYVTYYLFFKQTTTTTTTTVSTTVTKGTIENVIKTTGTAQLVNEQKIRFNQAGTVTAINFKEWAEVKKGEVIAEIDKTSVYNQIQQQQIALNNAKLTLLTDEKPAEAKDILQAENSVSNTQVQIDNQKLSNSQLQTEYQNKLFDAQNSITQKQADIDSKKAQLALLQSQLITLQSSEGKSLSDSDVQSQKTLTSAYTDSRKYLIDAQNYLKDVDDLFVFTTQSENYDNDSYLMFLSAKNSAAKDTVKTDYMSTKALYDQYSSLYTSIDSSTITSDQLISFLQNLATLYNSITNMWKDAMISVNASIPSLPNFSQSVIDSDYSSMNSIVSQSQSSYSSIQSTIATIKTLNDPTVQKQQSDNTIEQKKSAINDQQTSIDNAENDLKSLQNSLDLTKQNYANQFTQADSTLKNLENTLALNQANLDYVKAGTKSEQIQKDKNSIAQQELSLENIMKNLDNYEIKAPFDGRLRQIDFKVGDNIVSDDTKYLYIDNPNIIEITADLDQIDIAKVKVGQEVKIDFDSFTTTSFTWTVTQINSSPIESSGVTSYEIKVWMDKGQYDIYSGMTAKIQIVIARKSNVLVLPSEFITTGSGSTGSGGTVSTVTDTTWKSKEVVTWLTTSTQTEIASGLSEGDRVVRYITKSTTTSSSSSSSSKSSSSSSSSGGGWGDGGWMWGPPGGF